MLILSESYESMIKLDPSQAKLYRYNKEAKEYHDS